MLIKKMIAISLTLSMIVNPLGSAYAQTPTKQQLALQKKELNAAFQRLGINQKGATHQSVWNKVRNQFPKDVQQQIDFQMQFNPSKKFPEMSVSEIDRSESTGLRFYLKDGKSSVNIEMLTSEESGTKFKIGKSTFSESEIENPSKMLAKYKHENRKSYYKELEKQFDKKNFVLTAKELQSLAPKERATYFINLRMMLVSAHEVQLLFLEKEQASFQEKNGSFFAWLSFLNQVAEAQTLRRARTGTPCSVAGWVTSHIPAQGNVTCPFPENPEANRAKEACSSTPNTAPCQPSIFGYEQTRSASGGATTHKVYCVPFDFGNASRDSQRATLACHLKSPLNAANQPGRVRQTAALIRSMMLGGNTGDPNSIFDGDAVKNNPEAFNAAVAQAETILAETSRSINACISSMTDTGEVVAGRPQSSIAADRFKDINQDQDSRVDSEARQRLTCDVLMSRRTALESTISEWKNAGRPVGNNAVDCTRPGAIQSEPLAGNQGSSSTIAARPEVGCPNPEPATIVRDPAASQSEDSGIWPKVIISGIALLGLACFARIGICKKKKSSHKVVEQPPTTQPPITQPPGGEPPPVTPPVTPPPPVIEDNEGGNRPDPNTGAEQSIRPTPAGGVR